MQNAQDILPRRYQVNCEAREYPLGDKGTKNKDKTGRIDSWNILLKVKKEATTHE